MKKKYLEFYEIDEIMDVLIEMNAVAIDEACMEPDSLDIIQKLAIERCAYKKAKSLLIGGADEEEDK